MASGTKSDNGTLCEKKEAMQTKNNNGNKPEDEKDKEIDIDFFLSSAGEFGLYQWLLALSTLPFYALGGFIYFGQIFLTQVPTNHWCWIPELENLTMAERQMIAVPHDESERQGYSHCSAYVANWSEVLRTGVRPNSSWPVSPCMNGWEFNTTEFPYPTISTELGWVCDKSSYQATAQSIFFVGCIVGGFIIGWIADRYGRLAGATIAIIIPCIAGICTIFSTNLVTFSICRFFMGLGYDSCMSLFFVLILEYVGPNYRTLLANMSVALFYTLGMTTLPWIALACGHWKILSLATSIPMFICLLTPFVIPESPRWLLSRGRVEETIAKVIKIGRINKKAVPKEFIERFRISGTKNQENESVTSILSLLRIPVLRKTFIFVCLEYMFLLIVYDVSMRSVGQINYNFFIVFSINTLTQLPSSLVIAFCSDYIGRKWLTILVNVLGIPFCLVRAFVTGIPAVVCGTIVAFLISIGTAATAQWGAELLPTSVRGSGNSIIHICAFVTSILSPFIAYLDQVSSYLPFLICAIALVFSVIMAFNLPETAKTDLSQTLEDAEKFVKSQPFWDFPFRRKKV